VTKFQTGDGKVHDTELDAIAHETFLAVKGDLSEWRLGIGKYADNGRKESAYEIITTLAKKYEFVPRSAA
jgi:hypothetical protein